MPVSTQPLSTQPLSTQPPNTNPPNTNPPNTNPQNTNPPNTNASSANPPNTWNGQAANGPSLTAPTPRETPAIDLAQRLAALTPQQRAELASKLRPTASRSLPLLDRSSGRLPMSPAQRRHYFLQKLHPESPAYNNIEAVRVHGRLSLDAVREAVATLVRRHEVLRLRCEGPEFVLVDTPVIEVSQVDSAEGFAEPAERPFDLDRELPLRVVVAPEAILFVVHHIASDAWSCRLLVSEFFQAYAGKTLPPLEVQYADLAAAAQTTTAQTTTAQTTTAQTTTDVGYWRDRLEGMPPLIELPLDRPRPAVRDDHGAEIQLPLDRDSLHRTAKQAGVTPFSLLLTAFGYVLHRHCATRDIVVGTPVSGRTRVEAEQVIGCFINTVVLRLDLADAPTRRALVQRLWATTLDDLSHAGVPFERLVAELNPGRDLGAGQLVQVMFNHYQATEVSEAESFAVPRSRAKFDLTCTVVEASDGMTVTFNYATAILDRSFVDRLGEHFIAVLDALLDDLDAPMATLPAVPPSDPPYPGPGIVTGPTALQRFEKFARVTPDRVAVKCLDRTVSYAELNNWADRVGAWLAAQGTAPVALLFERSIEYVVAILAALKAGRPYVPLDPAMPGAHLERVCATAGAVLVLRDLPETGHDGPCQPAAPDDPMYFLFTSGSTGEPKGVVVEHRHFSAYLASLLNRMNLPEGMHFALVSTLAADLGLTNLYGALGTGGTLHLLPYEWATDPELFAGYFRRHRIDFMKLVPSHLAAIAEAGLLPDVVPHRFLVLAGEACPPGLVEAVRAAKPTCELWNHYGPTETTVSVLAHEITSLDRVVPLGHPLDHVGASVVDDKLRPVPRGAAGELLITGGSVARGYLDGPRFEGSYRCGDRVRMRADGAIEFLGRIDRQIKIRGYRVEPAHIEAVLRRFPQAGDVAVEPHPDRPALVAYHTGNATPSALLDFARDTLPPYMVPAAFVHLDRFPLTPNGKLDRRALPVPSGERASGTRTPPRDAGDERLLAIWSEVLGVPDMGIDDDLFELGGDSFTAMRLARAIGNGTRVVSIFQHPTIRRLSDSLDRHDSTGYLHRLPGPPSNDDTTTATTAIIVAIPFGGGTAASFADLAKALPADFPLYAVELPGHDPGHPDQRLETFDEIASGCVAEILGTPEANKMVLYGHCVGAALAFEIAHRLESEGADVAGVVVGGAYPAPRLPGKVFQLWARVFPSDRWRADRLYRDMLRSIGGIGDGLTEAELAVGLRALRHDARQSEDLYSTLCHDPTLDRTLPALCVVGERDRITEFPRERHREWNLLCASTDLAVIPEAGHYFLKHQPTQLAESIVDWTRSLPAKPIAPQPPPTRNISGFALVTLGQLVSLIGGRALAFALGIWVYLQTGSVTQFSVILVTALLPGLVVLPFAGAAADRWNRRLLMVIGEVTNAIGAGLCLIALATGSLQLWHIYLAASLGSIAASLQQPAYLAAVAQLIPKQYLARTNGILQAVVAVSQTAGPLAGGGLIVAAGLSGVFAFDLIAVGFALATLAFVRFPDLAFRRREESLWAEIGGGLRYLARRPPMLAMVGFFLCYNLILGFGLALTPAMVLSFAGGATLSLVSMVGAAGGILGGLIMAAWGGTARRATGMVGFVALTGIGFIIIGYQERPFFPIAGLALVMASIALINGHWQTMIQVKVGQELQGRILATNRMTANLTEPLGYVGAGWLADAVFEPLAAQPGRGMAMMLVILGGLTVALAFTGLRWRTLRHMEDALPDAVPGAVVTWDRDALEREADRALIKQSRG